MGKRLKRFSDFKLQSKLFMLIGIFLLSLLLIVSVVNIMFKSSQTITILVNEHRTFLENFNSGIEHFYRYDREGDLKEFELSKERFNKAIQIAYYFSTIDSVFEAMPREQWLPILFDVYKEGVDYDLGKIELMASQIKLFSKVKPAMFKDLSQVAGDASDLAKDIAKRIDSYLIFKTPEELDIIESQIKAMPELTLQFSTKLYHLGDYLNNMLTLLIIVLVVVLAGIVSFISLRISKSITEPINKLAENFKIIARGNLKSTVEINHNNEIGDLARAFLEIQVGLRKIISHSKKVAKGNYSFRLQPKSNEDELTPALNLMAAKLEESKIKSDKESWLQKGINDLDDNMRGNFSVRDLSERIIVYLSKFLQVEMGAVYVYDEVLDHLELTGSVGINLNEVKKIIKVGEGMIGTAAKSPECRMVETKEKYHKIYSASGEIFPEKIYLVSMFFDNRIQAVIELAPINSLSDSKIEFLKLVKENISVNLNASVARYRNKELLDQSIEQSEVLKARDLELNQKLEENQRIQENLSRETALLNSMLKTLPDYVYFKDKESQFIRISESMVGLFGAKSSDEIIGKSDFDYHPPKDAKRYFDEEQEIIKKGEGFIDEVRQGIDEKGEELWTSVTKLPMYDENGECIGTFGISKNVTQIKQLEIEVNAQYEKLKQNQEELKTANEELNAQEEELRVANEELAEQTKILTENEKHLQAQQEELRVANEELEQKTDLLELQKAEILEKNKELTKAGYELEKKAKELELASQYKSEFLANMSHELRTPLNSMLILSKILRDNKNGNLTNEQIKSVSIIYNSGRDLLDLINEILDLSKIEAGKMTFDFSEVLTSEIVSDIELNFAPVAENKNLSLKIEQLNGFPTMLFTDRQRFMQIVKNLMSNAFKFTSSGGITVKMGIPDNNVKFINSELRPSNTCFIAVEDSGVGIPQSKVDAIFDAFQQADGSISRKFGGTGLGLSISKQLIRGLGGEIKVASTEGVGSVFTVFLPLDKELVGKDSTRIVEEINKSEEADVAEKNKPVKELTEKQTNVAQIPFFIDDDRNSALTGMIVLIIHDDKYKAQKLIDLCHDRKFRAIAASNISDGIVLAEKFTPQAIIISADLNEPQEISKLKNNKFTARTPVHFVARIEDSLFESMEELETPESKVFKNNTQNIESKLRKEFQKVLVVEDDPATRIAIQQLLENKDIIIHEAKTGSQAFEMISTQPFDCIILDLGLPDFSGSELLEKLSAEKIPIPYVIVNTAKELSAKELRKLHKYSDSIVIKGIKSDERLMDEVSLFLHQVSNSFPKKLVSSVAGENGNSGFKGKKVLVVDDDIRNVFAMAQILEEREVEILEAENGEVAVDVLKKNKDIDLVLMDIMMPVMNGYEAMKIIRETPGIEHIPIITLTAKAMKEDYQKAIDYGANDFISKPVDVDKLLSLLKIWLFK